MATERMLAHVEKIVNIEPIADCDNIEYVTVLGWHVIQRKNSVKVGDKVVYIEIDSKVPSSNPAFAFLESRNYKVKSIKMRGVISQGLIMAFEDLGLNADDYAVGDDVTGTLGITKIYTEEELRLQREESYLNRIKNGKNGTTNKLIKWLLRFKWFRRIALRNNGKKTKGFPDFIRKTDEIRIENAPDLLKDNEKKWIQTEKIDGTSSTYAVKFYSKRRHEFIVCSRNVRQPHSMTADQLKSNPNNYWEIALKYSIEKALVDLHKKLGLAKEDVLILQGEIIGDSIQGNPYKISGHEFFGYNLTVSNIKTKEYSRFDSVTAKHYLKPYNINWVPILGTTTLPKTMEAMKLLAEGNSTINPKIKREGLVYRSEDGSVSFKNVSNSYLLKHNQ